MPLSDEQVKEATVPVGKSQLKISDGGGLYLLVKPSGRYWKLAYRFDGKQKSLALGVYPSVSLDDAREKRELARNQLADGIDPGLLKQQQKQKQKIVSARAAGEAEEAVINADMNQQLEPHPNQHHQPADFSLSEQARNEDRRLRILQLLADSNAYMTNEQLLQQALDAMGHKVSFDRLRTDIAWLYEQQVIYMEMGALWTVHLTRHGLDMVHSRTWIPGIKRPEPVR